MLFQTKKALSPEKGRKDRGTTLVRAYGVQHTLQAYRCYSNALTLTNNGS